MATILVAEDEFLIALDVMDELVSAGFDTIGPFPRTSEALDYCADNTPDCAVLDVRLVDGDSFPIADLLTARSVPIIFHSGHSSSAALNRRYPQARICPKPAGSLLIANLASELFARSQRSRLLHSAA